MTTPTLSPQRRRRLSSYFVLLCALFLVGGAYSVLAPNGYAEESASPDQIARGKEIFSLNCASCHGLNGEGGADAPSLVGAGSGAVDFQVGTGRMPMASVGMQSQRKTPKFSEEEIQALAAYVASLGEGPDQPTDAQLAIRKSDGSVEAGVDVTRGGRIYAENCAQCHSVAAQGGALTGGKAAPALTQATDKQIWEALETSPGNMPSFYRQLDDKDKKDVIAYVTEIRGKYDNGGTPVGRLGPVPEGAVGWVIGMGGLVVFCLWIGSRI